MLFYWFVLPTSTSGFGAQDPATDRCKQGCQYNLLQIGLMVGLRWFYWFSTFFQANQDALKSFSGSGIEVIMRIPNGGLLVLQNKVFN